MATTAPDDTDETAVAFHGAEHFLVGLSPQYWAHTPLSVMDLNNLGLVDGVDCLIVKSPRLEGCVPNTEQICRKRRKKSNDGSDNEAVHASLVPLSKCHIEGVVVNVDRKSNGSVLYLLDDGTGMIDCIAWTDDDLYSLPPLLGPIPSDNSKAKFRVGDVVRVMGKIRNVCVGDVRETVMVRGKVFQVRNCIREVQVNLMEHATPNRMRTSSISLNLESKHWLECIMFQKRAAFGRPNGVSNELVDVDGNNDIGNDVKAKGACSDDEDEPIRNGADVLQLLGPEVLASVTDCSDFPGADDDFGAWRLFGAGCRCDEPYKDSLLYCHCQASIEALDPHFTFRDALLAALLKMERDIPSDDCSGDSSLQVKQLHFQYKTILEHKQLASVAERVASKTGNPAANARRLYICTFRALRKDGILHLLDRETDTYLLVSRERVLEPYMRMISSKDTSAVLERRLLRAERPAFLVNMPSARLQYIKKSLKHQDSS